MISSRTKKEFRWINVHSLNISPWKGEQQYCKCECESNHFGAHRHCRNVKRNGRKSYYLSILAWFSWKLHLNLHEMDWKHLVNLLCTMNCAVNWWFIPCIRVGVDGFNEYAVKWLTMNLIHATVIIFALWLSLLMVVHIWILMSMRCGNLRHKFYRNIFTCVPFHSMHWCSLCEMFFCPRTYTSKRWMIKSM